MYRTLLSSSRVDALVTPTALLPDRGSSAVTGNVVFLCSVQSEVGSNGKMRLLWLNEFSVSGIRSHDPAPEGRKSQQVS